MLVKLVFSFAFIMTALCATCGGIMAADLEVKLEPVGGIYRMFNRPMSLAKGQQLEPVVLRLSLRNTGQNAFSGAAAFRTEDMFGKAIDWSPVLTVNVPPDGKWTSFDQTIEQGMVYCSISVDVKGGDQTARANTRFAPTAWTRSGRHPRAAPRPAARAAVQLEHVGRVYRRQARPRAGRRTEGHAGALPAQRHHEGLR